jgi:zinc protease
MADEVFGPWQARSVQGDGFSAPSNLEGGRVAVVDRPGAVQSEIRIGQVGVPRSTSLFFPLKVFNAVLGGAFTSRLMLNLREKQGFTYGVRSGFSFRRQAGPFTISTAVATEVTAPAVQEAMSELTHLLEGGPTEEEASRARDFIAGVFPLRFETTGQVASRLGELFVYDLPEDFFSTYRDRIREVTPETALDAGRTVLDPSRMVVTVVGDAEKIRGPLEELPFGPVEIEAPF